MEFTVLALLGPRGALCRVRPGSRTVGAVLGPWKGSESTSYGAGSGEGEGGRGMPSL